MTSRRSWQIVPTPGSTPFCGRFAARVRWLIRPQLEPWSREYDFGHPGFDPLAIAVAEAHRHGLRIEAYVNVMPGWKGLQPPPADLDPPQLYNAHPDWFLHDETGQQQPLSKFYVIVNPCLPEVRRHIVDVVSEIVTNYDVDGVHLDYVRYAWDVSPNAREKYPRDARTLALYRNECGGAHPDDDLNRWHHWRANQLTRLVGEIRLAVDQRRPGTALTAAIWRDPERGYRDYLQNAVAWLRTGLLDAGMPMAYSADADMLAREIANYHQLAPNAHIVPGVGIFKHAEPQQMLAQLQHCRDWGGDFALFSYDSLFPTHGDRKAKSAQRKQRQDDRHMRRDVLDQF